MSAYAVKACPITGEQVQCIPAMFTNGLGSRYLHEPEEIAISEFAEDALAGRKWCNGSGPLSPEEIKQAIHLLRSRFWRVKFHGLAAPFVTTREHPQHLERNPTLTDPSSQGFQVTFVEDVIEEAKSLSFTAKCHETLLNLYHVWDREGLVPIPDYHRLDDAGLTYFREVEGAVEEGIAYACSERLAPLVYNWLMEDGYLLDRVGEMPKFRISLSPKAMALIDKVRSGKDAALQRGFFIRRYDEGLDAFYRPLLDEVAKVTNCQIHAVWERQKNEKLDELILRRIRESAVIVLDVTGERFNVGLEAGYALALRKQIVLLRDKADAGPEGDRLPFDLRTLNCYFYDRSDPAALLEKLRERVLDALDEAKLGSGTV